jgi:hypothetical protein
MQKNIALLDANVYIALLKRSISLHQNFNQDLINFYGNLGIDCEYIEPSILNEVGNMFTKCFGSSVSLVIMEEFFHDTYYKSYQLTKYGLGEVWDIVNSFQTRWSIDKGIHKGIGYADARFLLTAKQIAEEEDFDDFKILTFDRDLRIAMQDHRFGINQFLVRPPRSDSGLIPVRHPILN